MSIFALENLNEVRNGKLSFYKLIANGKCLYDEFCEKIDKEKVNQSSLNRIRTYMNLMAENNCMLPKTKFNSIRHKNKVIGYEFKDKDLRLYILKKEPGIYVVLGGYKKNQDKDIKKFTSIIDEFQEWLDNIK